MLNATCSFPTETEQHELDPDCNGTDEMMTDETPLDNENRGDSETIVQKPLTSNQKKVIQNIDNNCGHPSKEEFLRALRLSRARPEVLDYVRRGVRVSSMCSQRSSSQTQTSSSVAADFSVQRNTWFGPFVPIVYSCCGQNC